MYGPSNDEEGPRTTRDPLAEQHITNNSEYDQVTTSNPARATKSVCPDCNASLVFGRASHDATCPAGRGIDRVCVEDAKWFACHRPVIRRWRALMPQERAELAGVGITGVTLVQVRKVGRGRHERLFYAGNVEVGGVLDVAAGPWGWAA